MGIYTRFKNDPSGLLKLVQLLESSLPDKKKEMIDFGLKHDAAYTNQALKYVIEYKDFYTLPPLEMAELMFGCAAQVIAGSIYEEPADIQKLFLEQVPIKFLRDVRDALELCKEKKTSSQNTRLRLISKAREVCQNGYLLSSKKVPTL